MRQSEKIERLQPFVRAILDSENQYAALMYGLVIQIKPHPVWGPIWQQQRAMAEPDIMVRLRPHPVFGGIVQAIKAEVARKGELYIDAMKAIGAPKSPKALKALELIESLLPTASGRERKNATLGIRAARFIDLCAPVTDTFLVRSV